MVTLNSVTRVSILIFCCKQGTWLVCSNLTATVDLSMVTLHKLCHQALFSNILLCAGHLVGVL